MNNYEFTKAITQIELKKAMQFYGIEKTEEKIKSVYRYMPYIKYYMLKEYYNITGRSALWKKMKK